MPLAVCILSRGALESGRTPARAAMSDDSVT